MAKWRNLAMCRTYPLKAAGLTAGMTFLLNFHGIGEAARPYESGEKPYWIDTDRFAAILDSVQASDQPVGITFDDGNASDYMIAAPALRERGCKAMFFVLAGKLDEPGYLTTQQVRELDADPLFTIGSHGMLHLPWPDCSVEELEQEVGSAQTILSQICDRPIAEVGLPFGRYDGRVLRKLRACGFSAIYSSDGCERLTARDPIPRFSVRSDTPIASLEAMIFQEASFTQRAKCELRALIKSMV